MIQFMQDLDQELADSGERVDAVGLVDPSQAKTVRFLDGVPVPTDGPFAETSTRVIGHHGARLEALISVDRRRRDAELVDRVEPVD